MSIKAQEGPGAPAETLRYRRRDDATLICQEGRGGAVELDPQAWPLAQKRTLTRVARVPGPFSVETTEGTMTCEDGWLAVDELGNPYPIAADVFDRTYVLVQPA